MTLTLQRFETHPGLVRCVLFCVVIIRVEVSRNPFVVDICLFAAESLYVWCKAMTMYHRASKVVKPKLEALNVAQNRLMEAEVGRRFVVSSVDAV
jgi:hypothetical protein